jgi:hypothetical protein
MSFPSRVETCIFLLLLDFPDSADIDRRLKAFTSSDWKAFFDFTTRSGLFPTCCSHLLHGKSLVIPRHYKSRLKQMFLLNLQRNSLLELELLAILDDFRNQGIEALPLKGPFLARYLYNDLALRRASADLDILMLDQQLRDAE